MLPRAASSAANLALLLKFKATARLAVGNVRIVADRPCGFACIASILRLPTGRFQSSPLKIGDAIHLGNLPMEKSLFE